MRLYEGMFVIDSSVADRSYDEVCAEMESAITKHGGKVVDLRKWDERRLAYEINRARRGTYVLVHFEAPPEAISEMRRDFVLSENILRQLLLVDKDGVPTGEERPGITTSISEASHRRRPSGPRRSREETSGDEGKNEDEDKKSAAEGVDKEAGEDAAAEDVDEEAGEDAAAEDVDEKAGEDAAAEDVDDDDASDEDESPDDGDEDDTGKDA